MIAIIGGSGLTNLANLEITRRQIVRTPFGEPSGPLTFGQIGSTEIAFLARHGYGHTLAPHEINYRANLWALHAKGVKRVLAARHRLVRRRIAPAPRERLVQQPDAERHHARRDDAWNEVRADSCVAALGGQGRGDRARARA